MPVHRLATVGQSFVFPEEEFDVLGDGSNETTKMQQAIDVASSQGRILILPPFTVKVTTLNIPADGLTMWGQVGASLQPLSELMSTGIDAPILRTTALTRQLELKNFKITGTSAGTSQHGILLGGNQSGLFNLEGLYIRLCGGDGIKINNSDYSYILNRIYSTANEGYQFNIDAATSPCVMLLNCYAGVVKTNKYGFYIQRGIVEMVNCNMLDGGTPPISCVQVGNSAIGAATVVFRNCNFESFTKYGVFVDIESNAQFWNCTFTPDATALLCQSLYMINPTGRSYIDPSTNFYDSGATYDNAAGLPVKVFSGVLNAPGISDPNGTSEQQLYWNSNSGRTEPFSNLFYRNACTEVTATPYTETSHSATYIGVNVGSAVAIHLFDPGDAECIAGRTVTIKDENGNASVNNITIDTVNTRQINGSINYIINTNYGSVTLVQRNGKYWTI